MKTKQSIWIVMTMVMSMAFFACSSNSTPDTATIHGTIIIRNVGVWAASGTHTIADLDSGVVEVTIFGDSIWTLSNGVRAPINAPFNAQNPTVLTRIFAGPYTGVGGDSTYEYTIEGLAPGTYSCLAVGFRSNRSYNSTKKTATLGVYWNNSNSVSSGLYIPAALNDPAPSTIIVAKGDNIQLDFKADFGFVNTWFYGIVPYIP